MQTLEFETDDGLLLEGKLDLPAAGAGPWPGVVVAHPHPLQGGSMDVPLVRAISGELARRGMAVLRFNFRGVGNSEGEFQGGEGEVNDVGAAVLALGSRPEVDRTQRALVGYSFGAWVGLRHFASDTRLRGFAAVAMPLWHQSPQLLRDDNRPKCFIAGSEDDVAPVDALRPLTLKAPQTTMIVLDGADHLFSGAFQRQVAERIGEFFESLFADEDV